MKVVLKILFLFVLVTLCIISINDAFAEPYWGNLKVDIEKSDRLEGENSDVIRIRAEFTNNDDEQITIYHMYTLLEDSQNREFSHSNYLTLGEKGHDVTEMECPWDFSVELNPGISEDTSFCFEVPKENVEFTLHLYESSPDWCRNPSYGSCNEKTVRLVVNPPSPKSSSSNTIPTHLTINTKGDITIVTGSNIPGCEETRTCFVPYQLNVGKGSTVTWLNADSVTHTVTSGSATDGPDGDFDSGIFSAGETFSHMFGNDGSFNYFCMLHPWMTGQVIVERGGVITTTPSVPVNPDVNDTPPYEPDLPIDEYYDNSILNSNYVPQFNKNLFDDSPKQIPRTSYVNQLYGFSLVPPAQWTTTENSELVGGESAAPVGFYSDNYNPEYTANFLVSYKNFGSSYFDLLRLLSDDAVLESIVSGLGFQSNAKINHKSIESYLNGYKINFGFVDTVKLDEGEFITLQRETVMYILDSRDLYILSFASTTDDFDSEIEAFRKASNTFHVGEVKFIEDKPTVKQEISNSESICGEGTIMKDGKCVVEMKTTESKGGGCLIATAAYGSELAPQVQQLRELRDNRLLNTASGTSFMTGFNQFYYSFSPTIADWERENPAFKEAVKIILTPMISSLSILNYVDIDSEVNVLGYGISLILLNIGMYFVTPAIVIHTIRKKF